MDKESGAAAAAGVTSSREVFGAPCWVNLMTRDLKDAQEFYGAVLGWRFARTRLGTGFSLAVSNGAPVASIGALEAALHAPAGWTPYFAVTDVDVSAARIRERSATVAVGPLRFPVGRGALAADRDGAVFGIWEGELIPDWLTWRKNAPAWLRLRTRNAFEAAIFYAEVLDWASEQAGCCQVDYEGDEVVLRQDGHVVARLSSGAVETAPDPLIQPRWHVHFPVADVEATVEAARRHGGSVLGRQTTPSGVTEVKLRDADGALFTVAGRPVRGDARQPAGTGT
ncbi:VOC family protein [Streptomyces lunaelactis]|uniref:VOC family protein n=1 Tax=Streptomyces lunaelactis TaxID=1535768 RepID=UPI001584ED90|nr:VOC family protein [Streptomyces lunaelactis]NUK00087.1 VOC family protein [Streptomyces lunaelactis]NUK06901.1 VOC family protein [Streptomyces lunaelactis]NUK15423.1 VOC family protein [Streptomyces lunaelactis]NUK24113.1 VOC family protein [Streptomyces lunaelactis]NUK33183.1 VOC family protein [Streptomyces lunaelactis]